MSARTIRATYKALRERLPEVIAIDPDRFGGAGRVLAMDGSGSLLEAVRGCANFRRHRKRHAPRMKGEEGERLLANELLVRMLCAIDLRGVNLAATEDRTLVMVGLIKGLATLRPRDPLQWLTEFIPGSRPQVHSESRLYEEYRRHLLKQPLVGAQ